MLPPLSAQSEKVGWQARYGKNGDDKQQHHRNRAGQQTGKPHIGTYPGNRKIRSADNRNAKRTAQLLCGAQGRARSPGMGAIDIGNHYRPERA